MIEGSIQDAQAAIPSYEEGKRLYVMFKSGDSNLDQPDANWRCNLIKFKLGKDASTAMCYLPFSEGTYEVGPMVLTSTSNTDKIKGGMLARVYSFDDSGSNITVFNGTVTNIAHQSDNKTDNVVVTLSDYKYLLEGIPVIGRFFSCGDGSISYQSGIAPKFNENGQPNKCMSIFGVPVFCETNLGRNPVVDGSEVGFDVPDDEKYTKSSYWTPGDEALYLRGAFFLEQIWRDYARPYFNFYKVIDSTIIHWPESAFAALDYDEIYGNSLRKAKELSLQGKNLKQALDEVVSQTGNCALDMSYDDDYVCTLGVQKTIFDGTAAIPLLRSIGPVTASEFLYYPSFSKCTWQTDFKDTYTSIVAIGKPIVFERRFLVEPDWDYAAKERFCNTWLDYALKNATPKTCFDKALTVSKRVAGAYRVDPTKNLADPTIITDDREDPESDDYWLLKDFPFAKMLREPKKQLVYSILEAAKLTSSLEAQTLSPMWIIPEYKKSADPKDVNHQWIPYPAGDLSFQKNSIILEKLRSEGKSFDVERFHKDATVENFDSCLYSIRMSIAYEIDHATWNQIILPNLKESLYYNNSIPGGDGTMPIDVGLSRMTESQETVDDMDLIDPQLSREKAIISDLYEESNILQSFPTPESVQGEEVNSIFRDDTGYEAAHLQKRSIEDFKAKKRGTFTYFHVFFLWRPGQQIDQVINVNGDSGGIISTYPIRAVVQEVEIRASDSEQATILTLG
jgi:hypothetical protein